MNLKHIPGTYGVAQLPPDAPIPTWLPTTGFSAILRADDEMTVVCLETNIPPDTPSENGWGCFRSIGPFAFNETGVVASLVGPISQAGIGVFVLCTFDGEHILYPQKDRARVVGALTRQGHSFLD